MPMNNGVPTGPGSAARPKPNLRSAMKSGTGAGASPHPGAIPFTPSSNTANPWRSSTGTNALKSHPANARGGGPSQATRPRSAMIAAPQSPSGIARQMNDLSLNPNQAQKWSSNNSVYNPSMGPSPSAITTKYRQTQAPSAATARTSRYTVKNAVCMLSNYTRRDFSLGDVISLPFHTANTNPGADPQDPRLSVTCEGPCYSKRRMMIVLLLHQQDLYCLPIYSFSGRGLDSKPLFLKNEYVCLKNRGDAHFVNDGKRDPVEVVTLKRAMTPSTTVHLTGGMKVGRNEDIAMVGRLTEESYYALAEMWKEVSEAKMGRNSTRFGFFLRFTFELGARVRLQRNRRKSAMDAND